MAAAPASADAPAPVSVPPAVAAAAPAPAAASADGAAPTASSSNGVANGTAAVVATGSGGDAFVAQLRAAVDAGLREHKLYDRFRALTAQQLADAKYPAKSDATAAASASTDAALAAVVDDVLHAVLSGATATVTAATTAPATASCPPFAAAYSALRFVAPTASSASASAGVSGRRRYMEVRVSGAKAFVDHISTGVGVGSGSGSGSAAFDAKSDPTAGAAAAGSHLWVVACWGGHRFESRAVAAAVDPAIDCTFVFPLQSEADSALLPLPALLTRSAEPVELLVLRAVPLLGVSPPQHSHVQLVAAHRVAWRQALVHGSFSQTVQLLSADDELGLPVGMLTVDVALHPLKLPPPNPNANPNVAGDSKSAVVVERPVFVESAAVSKQFAAERAQASALTAKWLAYAKAWLLEYEQLSPTLHPSRFVKVFAKSESGDVRCVCTFLSRIRSPPGHARALESTLHALRWVRLMEWRRAAGSGDGVGSGAVWLTPRAFVARRSGDHMEHSLLLASLLLGFGLDAYVVIGTRDGRDGAYSWVMTRAATAAAAEVMFWDAVTGQRHALPFGPTLTLQQQQLLDAAPLPYRKIHCAFNDVNVWANAQRDDSVRACDFTLEAPALWKAMNPHVIAALTALTSTPVPAPVVAAGASSAAVVAAGASASLDGSSAAYGSSASASASVSAANGSGDVSGTAAEPLRWSTVTVTPSAIDTAATEGAVEHELRALVRAFRSQQHHATTLFDDDFAYILSPALSAYEHERITGVCYGNSEFAQAVKRAVPTGYVFKGVPLQFNHCSAPKIFSALLANASCADALATRNGADHVRFAVCVRAVAYPENVIALWVMLAVRFQVMT